MPGSPSHPHPSLQEQLCQLYPRLKVLAFGAKPESTLHTYFPSFLSRANPDCPPKMRKEVRKWWEAPFSLPGVSCRGPCLHTKALSHGPVSWTSLSSLPTASCPTLSCSALRRSELEGQHIQVWLVSDVFPLTDE